MKQIQKEKLLCIAISITCFLQAIMNCRFIPGIIKQIQKGITFNADISSKMLTTIYIIPLIIVGILFIRYFRNSSEYRTKTKPKMIWYIILLFLIDAYLPCLIVLLYYFSLADSKTSKVNIKTEFKEFESDETNPLKRVFKGTYPILLYFAYPYLFVLGLFLLKLSYNTINSHQTLFSFIQQFSLLIIFLVIYRKDLINGYKNLIKNFDQYMKFAVKWWLLGLFVMVISNVLIANFTPVEQAQNEVIINGMIKQMPIYMLFTTAIYAPFVEELTFRKSLHKIVKSPIAFIFLSGFIFGLLHVVSSINSWYDLLYIIPYGSLGCCFAYIYHKTKNITVPITIHMIHNFILVGIQILTTFIIK